ncbi:unnamed protein product [Colias eurytheme]|nr:unnamed protein product [Colias eurytheme]
MLLQIPSAEIVVLGDFNAHHVEWLQSRTTDHAAITALLKCLFALKDNITARAVAASGCEERGARVEGGCRGDYHQLVKWPVTLMDLHYFRTERSHYLSLSITVLDEDTIPVPLSFPKIRVKSEGHTRMLYGNKMLHFIQELTVRNKKGKENEC